MSNIIPFEKAALPAYLTAGTPLGNTISTGGGFPSISIKGKVFHIRRGDELTLIANPDDPDVPAPYIDVVVLNANPGTAKVYYDSGYTEGSDASPVCYSNDGVTPSANSSNKQCETCAACAHNVWGSRITENGKKARECQDSKRLAVATVNAVKDAMLLRVPATSIKTLGEYVKLLQSRGVAQYQAVVTRIGFDYTVAHPALTFKPVGFVDEATFAEIREAVESDLVGNIIGTNETIIVRDEAQAPAAGPKKENKADAKPRKTTVKVEGEETAAAAAEPAKETPKAEPKSEPVVVENIDEGLDAALDSIDWDDNE